MASLTSDNSPEVSSIKISVLFNSALTKKLWAFALNVLNVVASFSFNFS